MVHAKITFYVLQDGSSPLQALHSPFIDSPLLELPP